MDDSLLMVSATRCLRGSLTFYFQYSCCLGPADNVLSCAHVQTSVFWHRVSYTQNVVVNLATRGSKYVFLLCTHTLLTAFSNKYIYFQHQCTLIILTFCYTLMLKTDKSTSLIKKMSYIIHWTTST